MKSVPLEPTFDPELRGSHSGLFHFAVLVAVDSFQFVDVSFPSLFSQEGVKAAVCVCLCVYSQYSNLALAATQWSLGFTFYSFSCPVVHYKMAESSSDEQFQYYLPHFGKHGVPTCLRFGRTCHNTAVYWISKQLSKKIFAIMNYK